MPADPMQGQVISNPPPQPQTPASPYGSASPNPPSPGGPSVPPAASPVPVPVVEDIEDKDEKNAIGKKLDGLSDGEMDSLARKVVEEFTRYKSGRYTQEQIWIECHQNFKGVYPAEMDFSNGTSRAFVQATRPRVVTGVAMIAPIILPPGDKSFTVDPSTNPYLPKFAAKLVGQGISPEEVRSQVMAEASKRADAMENRVQDGLDETGWPAKFIQTSLDMCLYGTSVLMGPMAIALKKKPMEKRSVWERIKNVFTGHYAALEKMGLEEDFRPEIEVVSPFDFYPDPSARSVEECDSCIVRKVVGRAQLREMRRREGFFSDAIDEVLDKNPDGNWVLEGSWEGAINITNSQQMQSAPSGRFVCLVRWGWLSGRDLRKAGISVDESQLEEQIMAQTWVIGNKVIALLVSTLHQDRLPFYVTPYSLIPHCIWGGGLAEMMRDSQASVNAYERMKLDNAAMCAGPQIFVTASRLMPGQNTRVVPRKTWLLRESESGSTQKPIEIYMPECRVAEYQASQDKALQFIQEQTNMPNMLMGFGGEGMHNRTSSGASMQFNSAVTPMKSVIFNIENHMIIPMIQAMCRFYLEFSKDETIRGDHKVIAKGVQGLMAREAIWEKVQGVLQFVGQRPEWSQQIDLNAVFKLALKDTGLTDVNIVLSPQVVAENQQKQMQMATDQQNQQMQAQGQMQSQQEKERAVSDPKDAIMDLVKDSPDGSKLQIALLNEAIKMWNFNTPDVMAAIGEDYQMTHMSQMTQAHQHGVAQGPGPDEMPTPPAPGPDPREMQMKMEKHNMDLAKTKAQIDAIKSKPTGKPA